MKIPFFGVRRQNESIKSQLCGIMTKIAETDQLVSGEKTAQLEEWLCSFTHFKHAICVHSGAQALEIIARFSQNRYIRIPSLTFRATLNAFLQVGKTPILDDVDSTNGLVVSECFPSVFVGLYGYRPPNVASLIEDAAQHWLVFNKNPNHAKNAMASVSFDPTKNISALGNGGAILLNNDEIAGKMRAFISHGKNMTGGTNSRMSELDAAVILEKTRFIEGWQQRRKDIARAYNSGLHGLRGTQSMVADDILPDHAVQKFVIKTESRDKLAAFLEYNGIETKVHYQPLHLMPEFNHVSKYDCPNAIHISEHCLSLPIYPELTAIEVEYIIDRIQLFHSVTQNTP